MGKVYTFTEKKEKGGEKKILDPEWLAIGVILASNIVGWVISHNHAVRNEARHMGKLSATIEGLSQRLDRLENRMDMLIMRSEKE